MLASKSRSGQRSITDPGTFARRGRRIALVAHGPSKVRDRAGFRFSEPTVGNKHVGSGIAQSTGIARETLLR